MQLNMSFPSFSCAIHQEAKSGGSYCGDSYYVREFDDYFVIAIADGLGSGTEAQFASEHAVGLLEQYHHLPLTDVVREVNRQLSGTRGVVLAIAKFFSKERRVEFLGIGNITFALYPATGRRIRVLSVPGYLDGRAVQWRKENLPYSSGDSFVMYSDGISATAEWTNALRLAETPVLGLQAIKQMWEQHNDDATVIVGRSSLS